jgi:triacylglycerol lipase
VLARNRRSVPLACQVLIYPMLVPPARSVDATMNDRRTGRYIWTRTSNAYCWSAFLPAGDDAGCDLAGLAGDLSRLPPAFIAVGDVDLFVHDDLAFAGRLLAAGCSVEAHVYPGAIHGFDRQVDADVTRRFTRELNAFLSRNL